jgi:hypothetical protein
MGSELTKLDIQKEWKSISEEAYRRAEKTHDQFNRDLVMVGAGFTALTALMVNVKPDLTGIVIATAFPILGAITAHFRNLNEEHLYKAFAAHALDMRDREIGDDEVLKLPRIDHGIKEYKKSGQYAPPTNLTILKHYRSAVIGATAGTAMAIVVGFSREGYDVFGNFRKEEDVTSQVSSEQKVEDTVTPQFSRVPQQSEFQAGGNLQFQQPQMHRR